MRLTVPAPVTLDGGLLEAELATALVLPLDDVHVVLAGDELEIDVPDETDEATVAAAVDAHDPEVAELPDGQALPADGATPALVRWRQVGAAGTDVTYDVNGATGTATADADGVVELAVTAATPGPVRVRIGTLELELAAQEV